MRKSPDADYIHIRNIKLDSCLFIEGEKKYRLKIQIKRHCEKLNAAV